jgi:hypothetical protein
LPLRGNASPGVVAFVAVCVGWVEEDETVFGYSLHHRVNDVPRTRQSRVRVADLAGGLPPALMQPAVDQV